MQQYFNNIIKLCKNNINSDLFIVYFVKYLKYLDLLAKAKDAKLLVDINIIKKLNLINISKRFR